MFAPLPETLANGSGSCAYLSNLVRTRVGPFDLCDAWTLSELAEAPLADEWERIAIAPDATAIGLDALVIDTGSGFPGSKANAGRSMPLVTSQGPVRVYDSAGNWLGIGEVAVATDARSCAHARSFRPMQIGIEDHR